MKHPYKQGKRDALDGKPRFVPKNSLDRSEYDRGYDAIQNRAFVAHDDNNGVVCPCCGRRNEDS